MLEVVKLIFCLTTHILDCYVFSKMINSRFKLNKKNILFMLVLSIVDYSIGINYSGVVRLLFTNLTTYVLLKIIFDEKSSKTLIGSLFIYLGYVVAEALFAIIFIGIIKLDSEYVFENSFWFIFVNIFDFIIYLLIFKIKYILKFIKKTTTWYEENKFFRLVIISFLGFLICYVVLYPIALNKEFINYNFMILCILIGIIVFVGGYFNEKSTNNQLTIKYDELLYYVKDYEKEVVEKGKVIHEHKNQLAVINDMIPNNNKKLKKYVSEKIEHINTIDDNIWLEKLTNLPTGGIKGLVYLKIKKMLDNRIDLFIDIDDKLKEKNKWKSINNNLEDYTKILGVYLDNATEASIDSKDKQIIIEFIDNKDNVEFILSNTYKGKINFSEIDNEKFSTKGNGRGYGLSLVKDIIDKNTYINQSREINGKFYVQKLYIKK